MMNPRVKSVQPNNNFTLTVVFENESVKVFDPKPYFDKGIFRELKDWEKFKKVQTFLGSVSWESGQDFCPDTLYLEGKEI